MDRMNGWFKDFTFIKFVLSLAFFTGVNVVAMQIHIADENRHLSIEDKSQLIAIEKHGFTFSQDEKIDVIARLKLVERRIEELDKRLEVYRLEGRLQTPEEKKDLIKEALKEFQATLP